jgi:LemA protein
VNFNSAVAEYNEAIAQFPAVILAWLFGFHPARGLREHAR